MKFLPTLESFDFHTFHYFTSQKLNRRLSRTKFPRLVNFLAMEFLTINFLRHSQKVCIERKNNEMQCHCDISQRLFQQKISQADFSELREYFYYHKFQFCDFSN